MSDARESDRGADGEHLADVPDGVGCAEIWEQLSDRREKDDD